MRRKRRTISRFDSRTAATNEASRCPCLDDISLSELTLEEVLDAVRVVRVEGEVLELGGELGEVGVVVLAGVVVAVAAVAVTGQGGVDIVGDGSWRKDCGSE